jgi:hypothetical protein
LSKFRWVGNPTYNQSQIGNAASYLGSTALSTLARIEETDFVQRKRLTRLFEFTGTIGINFFAKNEET